MLETRGHRTVGIFAPAGTKKKEQARMEATVNAPVIMDLGKASRKSIRALRKGRGKLLGDIQDAMDEVNTSLGDQGEGKQLVPVVLVYRKKARKRRAGDERGNGTYFGRDGW